MKQEVNLRTGSTRLEKFLMCQLLFTSIAFIYAWILQYRSADSNPNIIERFSFRVVDPPWTPPGTSSSPLLFLHHFGDWTLFQAYAKYQHPYDPGLPLPTNVPPLGLMSGKVIGILGLRLSYLVFLGITCLVWIFLTHRMLRNAQPLVKWVVFAFTFIFSAPVIFALDRGALYPLVFGLLGLALVFYEEERKTIAFLMLLMAVSLKPFVFLAAFWVIRKRRYREFLFTLIGISAINLILLIPYSRSITKAVPDYLHSLTFYSGSVAVPYVADGASLLSFIAKFHRAIFGSANENSFVINILKLSPIIYAALLAIVIWMAVDSAIEEGIALTVILSLTSLIVGVTQMYALCWCPLAILIYFRNGKIIQAKSKVDGLFLSTLFFSITTPIFLIFSTPSGAISHNLNVWTYQLLIMVYLCYLAASKAKLINLRKSKLS